MKFLRLLLLVGCAANVPTSYLTGKLFLEKYKKYTSEHDIVNIMVPLNEQNDINSYDCDSMKTTRSFEFSVLFFVQGDYKDDGTFANKGLFVLNIKTGVATKLLDNVTDFTAVGKDTEDVYFAATDGIYMYNAQNNSVVKYGSVTDNLVGIAKTKYGDIIYALTTDKELYKVTEDGGKKVKVKNVNNAHQIALDKEDNVYFYDDEKCIYVVSKDGSKKIDGPPENLNKVTLLRPPFVLQESIPAIIDSALYLVYANGTIERMPSELKVYPTAFSMEATCVRYFAYSKSIHENNIVKIRSQLQMN